MKTEDILDWGRAVEALAKAEGTWLLYLSVSGPETPMHEVSKAAPFGADVVAALSTGFCILRFGGEGAARRAFDRVVGNDGPTKLNPYKGPARVFAYLVGPNGGITENT